MRESSDSFRRHGRDRGVEKSGRGGMMGSRSGLRSGVINELGKGEARAWREHPVVTAITGHVPSQCRCEIGARRWADSRVHGPQASRTTERNIVGKTTINWADYTFNPWHGCTEVSAGCVNCYAEALDRRHLHSEKEHWGKGLERQIMRDSIWEQPHAWNRKALRDGAGRPRVFCASMADWADKEAPGGQREKLWNVIQQTPALDWLLLTKRPQNVLRYLPADWGDGYSNVWLGVTCENKLEGVPRLKILGKIPAKIRFVSFEPLLEDLGTLNLEGMHWAIIGGETGRSARPIAMEWVRSLLNQCRPSGVAAWVKQLGRFPTIGQQPLVLRDKEGHRDSKGEDPAIWPSNLQELKVRQLPISSLAIGR
jgi:protein gp37